MVSLNSIDKAMREAKAERISKKAKLILKEYIERKIKEITKEALAIARLEKRKTIKARHIEEALKQKTL